MLPDNPRQPIECTSCGTVNAWMNELCRSCGALLAEVGKPLDLSSQPPPRPAAAEETTRDSMSARPSAASEPNKRLAILWLVLGAMVYLAVVQIGANVLQKTVIAADPQVEKLLEKSMASGGGENALTAEEKAVIERHGPQIIKAVLPIMIGTPLLIGLFLGRITGSLREALWAVGVGCVMSNTAAFQGFSDAMLLAKVLLGVAMTIGIGALGALMGRAWYRGAARRKADSSV